MRPMQEMAAVGALAGALTAASTGYAATFDGKFVVEQSGGSSISYLLDDGSALSRLGLHRANPGDALPETLLFDEVRSGTVLGFYVGVPEAFDGTPPEFTRLTEESVLAANARSRIWGALWVNYSSQRVVFSHPGAGGRATLSRPSSYLAGPAPTLRSLSDALLELAAPPAVPVPAPIALLLAGLAALLGLRRFGSTSGNCRG